MMEQETVSKTKHLVDPAPLALAAFALPLFIWSGFNADFFNRASENFIIPLAIFFGGPLTIGAAMWAYHRRDGYLGTLAAAMGAFWLTYGMLLWLIHTGVVGKPAALDDNLRGFFFVGWAVTFGVMWLASIREHWTLGLISLGAGAMFVLLAIGYYRTADTPLKIGGWIGFVTAGLAWYAALAEMLNAEFERPVLPTDVNWFRENLHLGTR